MGNIGSSDRSRVDGRGLQITFGPQVRPGTCDPGAREAEERKVVDELTRVEPTAHGSAGFLTLALQAEVREFLTYSKISAIQQREGSDRLGQDEREELSGAGDAEPTMALALGVPQEETIREEGNLF